MALTDNQTKLQILCMTVLVETSPQALPLGAACIASALKSDSSISENYSVSLKSFSLEQHNVQTVVDYILSISHLKILMPSVYVWNRLFLSQVIEKVKAARPEVTVIAGGPEITANPFSFQCSDYNISGEGEVSNVALVKSILSEGSLQKIDGVFDTNDFASYNSASVELQKQMVLLAKRSVQPDCTILSSPYLDGTIDPAEYGGALWELARGCPFKCSYCYESKGGKKVIHFPKERLLKELELFAQKKVPQVFVLDPTYNADKQSALEMLRSIRQITPNTFYYFEARAEFIDSQLAGAFSEIPCALQIGLQSSDEKVLALVHRSFNRRQFVRNIGILNDNGVNFGFDLIYGLPGDNFNGFKASIDFALSLYPNNLELFCLSVLPGTDLFDRSQELGLVFQNEPPYSVIQNTTFSRHEISLAAGLAKAAYYFYTAGRAVPWFNTICSAVHLKPSGFLSQFQKFAGEHNVNLSLCNDEDFLLIQKVQLEFLKELFSSRNVPALYEAARDLVVFNGAISQCTAGGNELTVNLSYHPDDLSTEYATDLHFFTANARKYPNAIRVFCGPDGVDFAVVNNGRRHKK